MQIGVLSDTHNQVDAARCALDLLIKHGVGHLVHCGDIGEDVLEVVSATCQEHGIRAHIAIGNCDRPHLEDAPFLPVPAGVERAEALDFVLSGKRCFVIHGDRAEPLHRALQSGQYDFVFTGHTHAPADERVQQTRHLNPGAVTRPRSGSPTVLLLDLMTGETNWLVL